MTSKHLKRQALRNRIREQRATRRARKAVATATPQTARTHLLAAGIDTTTAKRYAGAFSRGAAATTTADTTVKLKGRTHKTVPVKLYDQAAFATRLASYRPKDPTAAHHFERAAHSLAA